MHHIKLKLFGFVALSFLLSSCGGAGSITNPNASSISLTASTQTITYGQSVNINWIGHNIGSISEASFPVDGAALTGSITDKPATTTTYSITAWGEDSESHSATVTVNVAKGNKKILFVGDTAQSGVNQLIEFLQALTNQTVDVSPNLPSSFTADVVVLSPSASISAADIPKVQAQLTAGKGVVLINEATALLATGDANNSNISAIGSFCAGVTNLSGGGWYSLVEISPVGIPFGANLLGKTGFTDADIWPISANAIPLTNTDGTSGFLYSPPIGGRIAFAGKAPIDASEFSVAIRSMFLAEVRWASGE